MYPEGNEAFGRLVVLTFSEKFQGQEEILHTIYIFLENYYKIIQKD
jgi:hypothetical protein